VGHAAERLRDRAAPQLPTARNAVDVVRSSDQLAVIITCSGVRRSLRRPRLAHHRSHRLPTP
jgi:hypothetical protein